MIKPILIVCGITAAAATHAQGPTRVASFDLADAFLRRAAHVTIEPVIRPPIGVFVEGRLQFERESSVATHQTTAGAGVRWYPFALRVRATDPPLAPFLGVGGVVGLAIGRDIFCLAQDHHLPEEGTACPRFRHRTRLAPTAHAGVRLANGRAIVDVFARAIHTTTGPSGYTQEARWDITGALTLGFAWR